MPNFATGSRSHPSLNPRQAQLSRLLQNIVKAPLVHVDGKHLFIHQTAAKSRARIPSFQVLLEPPQQLSPNPGWNVMALRRVDVAEQHQRPKQHLPVFPNKVHLPVPIETAVGTVDHVCNVSAVKALTHSDEKLGG